MKSTTDFTSTSELAWSPWYTSEQGLLLAPSPVGVAQVERVMHKPRKQKYRTLQPAEGQKVLAMADHYLMPPRIWSTGVYFAGWVQKWKVGVLGLPQLRRKTGRTPLKGYS